MVSLMQRYSCLNYPEKNQTKDVDVRNNFEKIRRHKETLHTIVARVEELKRDIEQEKLEKEETVGEIKE